jgi:hypothetical protein
VLDEGCNASAPGCGVEIVDERVDYRRRDRAYETGLQVVASAGRVVLVDAALQGNVRCRSHSILQRLAELAQSGELALRCGFAAAVTNLERSDAPVRRRHDVEHDEEVVRCIGNEVRVRAQQCARLREGKNQEPAVHLRGDGVQLKFERRHDAEVAATAAQRPQQIWILAGARRDEAAVRTDHVGCDQTVARQAEAASKAAEAAAEGKAADTRLRDSAHRSCQAECLRRAIELTENDTGLYERGARLWVYTNVVHRREIDEQSTLAGRMTRKAVPSSAHCDQQLMVASESDSTDHIVGIRAARDQCGLAIEGPVPHLARGFVLRVCRQKDLSTETGSQGIDIGRSQARAGRRQQPRLR